MSRHLVVSLFALLVLAGSFLGCARAARDTTGFAVNESAVVEAPFDETWQAAKSVLREMELNIYTRDKRGKFVAFSDMERQLILFTPEREQLTVSLDPVTAESTAVDVEVLRQVYGVTLLTYPDWHARKTNDAALASTFLESLQTRLAMP
jgi:hypothetical protein